MSGNQKNRTWQTDLVASHPDLFNQKFDGHVATPGCPTVGDGWRDLVEKAVGRIADAVAMAPSGSVGIDQIKEKFGCLRLYWQGRAGLPDVAHAAIEEAVSLAVARSACTCEQCGEPGRLFERGGWFMTACDKHAKGEAAKVRPGWENLHVTRAIKNGKIQIVSCRRYNRDTDSFVDVPPAELGIQE